MFTVIFIVLILYHITFSGILSWFWFKMGTIRENVEFDGEYPFISVLVPARNEQDKIKHCLEALTNLDYPGDRFEVIVGEDHSEDNTREIVERFIKDKPGFQLIPVGDNLGKAKGKANALAWMIKRAKGSYYFFVDADIIVPPGWAKGLLTSLNGRTGIVSGTTVVKGHTAFAEMQSLEWLYYMALLRSLNDWKTVTPVGNNMFVKEEAYRETGGYEEIEFSVTEDFKLYSGLSRNGWKHKQIFHPSVLGVSMPVTSLRSLLDQRKRWLTGGKDLLPVIKALMLFHGAYYPLMLLFLVLAPVYGIFFLLMKWLLQGILIHRAGKTLELRIHFWKLFIFEPYHFLISFLTLLYNYLPFTWTWKGRRY